jgi:shikimate dehydrogenase
MPGAEQVRRAAVLGHPIAHSLSPVLHLAAYRALGLPWEYERIDMTGDRLESFVRGLDASWAGLSLTMPLKVDVLPLLDEVDDVVVITRAANTVVLRDGRRFGANTDVDGILSALRESQGSAASSPGSVVESTPSATVLGGGATARSALAALARWGVPRVSAFVRRAEAGADLRRTGDALGLSVDVRAWDEAAAGLSSSLVVSTVPTGVADHLASVVVDRPGTLLDVVYDPWPTPLAAAWGAAGGEVASGLDMLLHQAVGQVQLLTGLRPPVDVMRAALEAAAGSR